MRHVLRRFLVSFSSIVAFLRRFLVMCWTPMREIVVLAMVCRILRGFYRFLVVQIPKLSCFTWVLCVFFWVGAVFARFSRGFSHPLFPASRVLHRFLVGFSSIVVFVCACACFCVCLVCFGAFSCVCVCS